jgi:hypothetical protein
MVCVCLKVAWKEHACNYGFIYFAPSIDDGVYTPQYISLAPAFSSQDGEYRGRYMVYDQFCKLFETFPLMCDEVEDHMLKQIRSGKLELGSEFCISLDAQDRTSWFMEYIDEHRILIRAYVICWLIDYYNIYHHIEENHINESYKKIFAQPGDRDVFERVYGVNELDYKLFLRAATSFYNTLPDKEGLRRMIVHTGSCGQKIFPITHVETALTDNINYNIWREIYIGNICGNLVLNHITPSFPMLVGWYYIQQSRATLFDNDAMRIKYEHSRIAEEITDVLGAVNLLNYKEKNKDFGAISTNFKELSASIDATLEFADSDIKLADISIVLLTEYVGKTLQDSARLINGTYKDVSILEIYTNPHLFAKMYFEFLYSLYCANSKSMVIHGDLHMNNATIYKFFDLPNSGLTMVGPSVAFTLRDTTYVFPHNGTYGVIIDFSRSILGNRSGLTHTFSKTFSDEFIRDQNMRFLETIKVHLPAFYNKWSSDIMNMLLYDFDTIFKFMTILDSYVITNNILFLLRAKDFTNVDIHPDCFALLQSASKIIDGLLNTIMQGIIERSELDFEWPNYTLIQALFDDYVYDADRIKKEAGSLSILDIFNENLPLKHDGEDVDSWGPLLDGLYLSDLLRTHAPDSVAAKLYNRYYDIVGIDETTELQNLHAKYITHNNDELEPWMID